MGGGFRRTFSFPFPRKKPTATSLLQSPSATSSPFHDRSCSLPASPPHTTPDLSQLHASLLSLRNWVPDPTPSSMAHGLYLLSSLLSSLSGLLRSHPDHTYLAHCRWVPTASASLLLDLFLRLADAHCSFHSAILTLRHVIADALSALRRRDPALLSSSLRSLRRSDRSLSRLSASSRHVTPLGPSPADPDAALVMDSASASSAASAAVFSGVAAISAASTALAASAVGPACSSWVSFRFPSPLSSPSPSPAWSSTKPAGTPGRGEKAARLRGKVWWVVKLLKWRARSAASRGSAEVSREAPTSPEAEDEGGWEEERKGAMERLRKLEEFAGEVERSSEEIYRSILNIRVSLLNMLTPTF